MVSTFLLTVVSFHIIKYRIKFGENIFSGVIRIIIVVLLFQIYTYYSISFFSVNTDDIYLPRIKKDIGNLAFPNILFNGKVFYYSYTLTLFHLFPPLGVWLIYRLLMGFYLTQKLKEENLQLEMGYLRAQINPHFLLNTLTAIYNMVMDNPKAAQSIETLSGLLQYSLYDTGSEKVPLEKEIRFIRNYIKLSKIRLNTNKKLIFTISGNKPEGQTIVPLILVNLVENCIKHGLHQVSGAAKAEITLMLEVNTLHLNTYNRLPETASALRGGIGLENTRRRLEIYYSGRYELNVNDKNGFYHLSLKIEL